MFLRSVGAEAELDTVGTNIAKAQTKDVEDQTKTTKDCESVLQYCDTPIREPQSHCSMYNRKSIESGLILTHRGVHSKSLSDDYYHVPDISSYPTLVLTKSG